MDDNFLSQFTKKDNKDEKNSKPEVKSNLKPESKDQSKVNAPSGENFNTQPEIKPASGSHPSGLGNKTAKPETGKKNKKLDLDSFSNQKSPNQKKAKSNQKIATTEHVVEKDDSYHKRKMIRNGIIGGSALVGCLLLFFMVRLINQVEVKDFVGTNIAEARTWGLTSKITIEEDQVFDIEYDENMIIEQSVEASGKLQKGSVLKLTVSKGPDPEEIIEIPDLESMTLNDVNEWRRSLRLDGVTVREEYDDEIEEGHFIKKEFARNVDEEAYRRRDGLVIYMSKGVEVFEANIPVPDFKDKSKMEVESWAKENEIDLTIEERASSTVEIDHVISQSIEKDEKIAKHDEMTVVVSLGKSITVPNFSHYTSEDASTIAPELNTLVQQRYSSTVAFGRLISQSEPAGKELIVDENMPVITLVYSLGQPFMESLIGDSVQVVAERFHNFTSRGANITYTINYVDSSAPKGEIVDMSKHSDFLAMTDHVNISVSKGNLNPPQEEVPADLPEEDVPELNENE